MSGTDTKQQILEAAEQLFGESGFTSTSLRAITTAAGVNLAAVNYHFGSKEELAKAVIGRHLAPLNEERLRRLDAAEEAAGGEPALEDVVASFLGPALDLAREENQAAGITRLLGRIYSEQPPFIGELFAEKFADLVQRFLQAIERCLPELDRSVVFWRMHFMVGTMAHTLCTNNLLTLFTSGHCNMKDIDHVTRQMVAFVAAGMRAPVITAVEESR
ncbi:MAG: TetR/AcrR family transcriptional regulator [Planctomycetota bacterium]|jgi:AcrR family transcriptional regulator